MSLLIKFTQALGNSFQLHVKDLPNGKRTASRTKWKPKPESWYYFEPGCITLGVKKNCDWEKYQAVCLELEKQINNLGLDIQEGILSYDQAKEKAHELMKRYNPWEFVQHSPRPQRNTH